MDTRVPFTTSQAAAHGISPRQLRGKRYRRIFRAVYVEAEVEDSVELRCRAALLIHPAGAVISHTTAARLLGLPVDGDEVHISVADAKHRRRRRGIVNHIHRGGARNHQGWPLVSGPDLFLQLAELLGLVELVIAGDAMVRRRQASAAQLVSAAATVPGRVGGHAREAAGFVRAGVDSPMETRLRLLLVLAGFPEPQVNHTIRNDLGDVVARFDLSYPSLRLVIEYDGRQHRADLDQWDTDIDRREWLDRSRWRMIVVVARDIYRRPEVLLDRVAMAMRDGGGDPPGNFDPRWRTYFAPGS